MVKIPHQEDVPPEGGPWIRTRPFCKNVILTRISSIKHQGQRLTETFLGAPFRGLFM
jgi:hypothetical protein